MLDHKFSGREREEIDQAMTGKNGAVRLQQQSAGFFLPGDSDIGGKRRRQKRAIFLEELAVFWLLLFSNRQFQSEAGASGDADLFADEPIRLGREFYRLPA